MRANDSIIATARIDPVFEATLDALARGARDSRPYPVAGKQPAPGEAPRSAPAAVSLSINPLDHSKPGKGNKPSDP
jgi:hypothetical protein